MMAIVSKNSLNDGVTRNIFSSSSELCKEELRTILNDVSAMTLRERKHYQQYQRHHQMQQNYHEPRSPSSINKRVDTSRLISAAEVSASSQEERMYPVWTTPPEAPDVKYPEASPSLSCTATPLEMMLLNTRTTISPKSFIGRKRQRGCISRKLSLMLPGSAELDDTIDGNPFRRHVAIHSPIAGFGNTINQGFIGKIKPSKSPHVSHSQQLSVPPPWPTNANEQPRSSSPCDSLVSSEDIDRIRNLFPTLGNDLYEGDGSKTTDGKRKRGLCSSRRALKMRRQRRNEITNDIFDPTAFALS
mmetsp:Transcript_27738/g.59291  ORF Transcript_27738/g.59291 Transcript_27738/m.59291 type:complete len:302 (-) Transcript_27738:92-997(-)